MPKLPDTAGSTRARLRLIAVLLLAVLTAYWAVSALWLLFLPDSTVGAVSYVVLGAIHLIAAAAYALVTWWTFRRLRWGHVVGLLVTGVGFLFSFNIPMTWDSWLLAAANLAALVLLILTVPRRKAA